MKSEVHASRFQVRKVRAPIGMQQCNYECSIVVRSHAGQFALGPDSTTMVQGERQQLISTTPGLIGGHDPNRVTDPRDIIADLPITWFQIGIIAVLFFLNALDGFDVLAIAFAAPGIAKDWSTSPGALGAVISLGLFGNGFGSLVVAPLGDKIGRRPMILGSLAAMTAGMTLCAVATALPALSAGRLITGIGVGALVPLISALSAEYANRRNRDLAVIIMAIGFPVGGLIGGGASAILLRYFGWHAVFAAGAVATGLITLAPLLFVPESLEYLINKASPQSLQRINAIMARLKQPLLSSLPSVRGGGGGRAGSDIFLRPALLATAVIVTLIYALHNATLYYALNWIPKIVVDLALSPSQAAGVAAWCSGGGIVGALIVAALSARLDVKPMTAVLLFGTGALLCVFARTPGRIALLTASSVLLGAFLYGAQASLYALMTRSFPVHVRATGVGFATGVGRLGGMISPVVSGHLLGAGLGHVEVSTFMALGSSLGAALLLANIVIAGARSKKPLQP